MKIIALLMAIAFVSACSDETYVVLNTATLPTDHYRVIDEPRDAVWETSVPKLDKQFFTVDFLDKKSGVINISYSGDPEKFVDCGHVTSRVRDAKGEHSYDFPAAKGQAAYEIMNGDVLFHIDRKMSVVARASLVFKETNPNQTQVSVNTLYTLQKDVTARRADNDFTQSWSDSISFGSQGSTPFGNDINSATTTVCVANGEFEREILATIK